MLFTDAVVSLVNIDKSLFGMVEIVWSHLQKNIYNKMIIILILVLV